MTFDLISFKVEWRGLALRYAFDPVEGVTTYQWVLIQARRAEARHRLMDFSRYRPGRVEVRQRDPTQADALYDIERTARAVRSSMAQGAAS